MRRTIDGNPPACSATPSTRICSPARNVLPSARARGAVIRAALLFSLLLSLRSSAQGTEALTDDAEFFEKSVRPILVEKCWSCHGATGKIKGGLRLVSRASILKGGDSGPAAVAGNAAASLIVRATRYDQDPKMPPKGKLPDREIEVLRAGLRWAFPGPRLNLSPNQPPKLAGLVPSRPRGSGQQNQSTTLPFQGSLIVRRLNRPSTVFCFPS